MEVRFLPGMWAPPWPGELNSCNWENPECSRWPLDWWGHGAGSLGGPRSASGTVTRGEEESV